MGSDKRHNSMEWIGDKTMTIETRQVLIADEGKILTNGKTSGYVIWLSKTDVPENWIEIDAPKE